MGNIKKISNKNKSTTKIYQFKIILKHIKPEIWRRIQVKSDINLAEFHLFLNEAMGWYNSHLHQFIIEDNYYGMCDDDLVFELDYEIKDEEDYEIKDVITKEKQKILYEYDFGDGWEHEVVLEKILDLEDGIEYPRCIAGEKACPPEDCGSYSGYENICELMKNSDDSEYEEMIEWLGGIYDPEEFDLKKYK